MEVRGFEPRSAEFFVSNSPSAAAAWLSAREIAAAIFPLVYPGSAWLGGSGTLRGHPALAAPLPDGAGTHQTGRATYRSSSLCHL